jgi:hypothetical protein
MTNLEGRRVPRVSFHFPVFVVTSSHSAVTVLVAVQSFVKVAVSVTLKAARCGVAAPAAPQARVSTQNATIETPIFRSTKPILKQMRRKSGSFGPSASLNTVAGPRSGLGVRLED